MSMRDPSGPERRPAMPPLPAMVAWAIAIVMGSALAIAARHAGPLAGDQSAGRFIQELPGTLERPLEWLQTVTATGTVAVLTLALACAVGIGGRRREAAVVVATLVVLLVLQPALKDLVDRPRPGGDVLERRVVFSSPSFPAGHVMSGTVLIGLVLLAAGRPRPVPVAGAALVALVNGGASVYLGAHWPSDVVGGYAWAMVILLPAWFARERMPRVTAMHPRGRTHS